MPCNCSAFQKIGVIISNKVIKLAINLEKSLYLENNRPSTEIAGIDIININGNVIKI